MMKIIATTIFLFPILASIAYGADVRQQLQGISREIKEKKLLIKKTAQVENKVSGELVQIDKSLREKQSNLSLLGRDLLVVEKNLQRTRGETETARTDVERKRSGIQKRLVSLYKAGDVGTIRMFFSSGSFPQMLENLRYMKSLLENDRKMVAEYNARIEKLKGLEGSLAQDASRKEKIKRSIEIKKNEIEAEKRKKAVKLVQVKQEKKTYQTSLLELETNARRLQSIVERLEARSKKQRQTKELEVRSSIKPLSVPPPLSDKGFGSQKGRLSMPVKGTVISGFGKHKHPQFNSYTMSNGISIAAPSGSGVRAVYEGKVIFAEYFKGYGNMVILDHGGGYFSLYAHNATMSKKVGTNVEKNDILATVGDVDSQNGPMLYFEIRYQGKPVDPTPWVR
ncbi:MAG: peptidoglycan DD-metalloendopeptidase family protein [Deltaproteobacteria bacterium]